MISDDATVPRAVFDVTESGRWKMREACDLHTALSSLLFSGPLAAIVIDADLSALATRMLLRLLRIRSNTVPVVIVATDPSLGAPDGVPVLEKPLTVSSLRTALRLVPTHSVAAGVQKTVAA